MRKCQSKTDIGECFAEAVKQCLSCEQYFCLTHEASHLASHLGQLQSTIVANDRDFWTMVFTSRVAQGSNNQFAGLSACEAVDIRNKLFPPKEPI